MFYTIYHMCQFHFKNMSFTDIKCYIQYYNNNIFIVLNKYMFPGTIILLLLLCISHLMKIVYSLTKLSIIIFYIINTNYSNVVCY